MLGLSNLYRNLLASLAVMLAAYLLMPVALADATGQAGNQALRIHRYAAFNTQSVTDSNKAFDATSGSRTRQRTQVHVYGKQLTLNLENNDHLNEALTTSGNHIELLRGNLEGKPHSWARLTRTSNGTHGLIWDGSELYAIEPAAEVNSALANSLPTPSSDTVIFKLSDTTLDLGAEYCGAEHASSDTVNTGLAAYQALTDELTAQATHTDGEPTLRLEMQALADAAFRAQYSSDKAALDAIMVRLNNVDGIFTAQMGLEIQATNVQIYSSDPTALSSSTSADELLSSLGKLRNAAPGMSTYAATHLFTGRDLDGDTLGIAYIGNICGARYGASLSEVRNRGAWIDSLVVAHELGHQLGAVHDGTGACGGTAAQSYLMGAQINGSSELSQCSRDSILATMQYAACLVPVGTAEVSIANASTEVASAEGGGGAFALSYLLLLSSCAYLRRNQLKRRSSQRLES